MKIIEPTGKVARAMHTKTSMIWRSHDNLYMTLAWQSESNNQIRVLDLNTDITTLVNRDVIVMEVYPNAALVLEPKEQADA